MKTFFFIALFAITSASAEKISIVLKSGGTMTGLLVGKSDAEIKIETEYGIIPLRVDAVAPESWTAAHRATPTKPAGKYVVPNPSPKPPQFGKQIEKMEAGLSVDEIERVYAANPVAADLRFKNKPIAVTGVINNIGTSEWGRPFVRIGDRVIKHFPWGSEKKIARLKVGQTTTLTGTCYGVTPPAEGSRIVIRESLSYERNPRR